MPSRHIFQSSKATGGKPRNFHVRVGGFGIRPAESSDRVYRDFPGIAGLHLARSQNEIVFVDFTGFSSVGMELVIDSPAPLIEFPHDAEQTPSFRDVDLEHFADRKRHDEFFAAVVGSVDQRQPHFGADGGVPHGHNFGRPLFLAVLLRDDPIDDVMIVARLDVLIIARVRDFSERQALLDHADFFDGHAGWHAWSVCVREGSRGDFAGLVGIDAHWPANGSARCLEWRDRGFSPGLASYRATSTGLRRT